VSANRTGYFLFNELKTKPLHVLKLASTRRKARHNNEPLHNGHLARGQGAEVAILGRQSCSMKPVVFSERRMATFLFF